MGLFTSFQLKSRDADTRKRAALSLGVRGRRSAIASLEPLLVDPEWSVRQAAVEALGVVADAAAVPVLVAAVKQADQIQDQAGAAALRASVVEAFGRIGAASVAPLLEALRDRHAKLRETAIAALGAIGGRDAESALASMLADDRSSVRQAAAAALARTAGPAAVSALRTALGHKDPVTRRCAADALATVRHASAVEAVRAALGDRDRQVRDAAVHALAAIGTPDAVSALIAALPAADRDLKAALSAALRSFEWVPADTSQRVVHAALHGRFDEAAAAGAAAVEPLMAALADRDASTRLGAVTSLGRLGDPRAAAAIAALFKDSEASVREAAADALVALGPASSHALVDTLHERAMTVRTAADRALSGIGEGRVAAALLAEVEVGQPTQHGAIDLRVVASRTDLDAARRAADALESLLAHARKKLPVDTLRHVVALADVILLEPGEVPGNSDTLDAGALRQHAREELSRRGV